MQLGYRDRNAGFITPPAAYLGNDNFLMGNCKMLTQSKLKEILHYCPETGILTWININKYKPERNNCPAGTLNPSGYINIVIDGASYKSHRLAWLYMTGKMPKNQIDHINHNRSDNRWANLRQATRKENQRNQSKYDNNTSGINGVGWHKKDKKWRSRIGVNQEEIYLGSFTDKWDAICARKSADNKYGFHENHGK